MSGPDDLKSRPMYDAGVLIAADRNDRSTWVLHRRLLDNGLRPFVPAPVVAQVSRSPRQANLHRLLADCEVVEFDAGDGPRVGRLLGAAGTSDVVDGHVAVAAMRNDCDVVTSDLDDIQHLADHLPRPIIVRPV